MKCDYTPPINFHSPPIIIFIVFVILPTNTGSNSDNNKTLVKKSVCCGFFFFIYFSTKLISFLQKTEINHARVESPKKLLMQEIRAAVHVSENMIFSTLFYSFLLFFLSTLYHKANNIEFCFLHGDEILIFYTKNSCRELISIASNSFIATIMAFIYYIYIYIVIYIIITFIATKLFCAYYRKLLSVHMARVNISGHVKG